MDKPVYEMPASEFMGVYQVVAVYPSGNRYPVREPHVGLASAQSHRDACERFADPADTWHYEIERV